MSENVFEQRIIVLNTLPMDPMGNVFGLLSFFENKSIMN